MSRLNMLLTKKMAEVAQQTFLNAHAAWKKAAIKCSCSPTGIHASNAAWHASMSRQTEDKAKAQALVAQNAFYAAKAARIKANAECSPVSVVSMASTAAATKAREARDAEDLAQARLWRLQDMYYAAIAARVRANAECNRAEIVYAAVLAWVAQENFIREKTRIASLAAAAAHQKAKAAYLALSTDSADRRLLHKVHLKYIAVPTTVPTTVPTEE